MKYEVFKSGKQWFFHLRARNGKIELASQGYSRRIDAIKTVRAIKRSGEAEIVILK